MHSGLRDSSLVAQVLDGLSLVSCKGILDDGHLGPVVVQTSWSFSVSCACCHVATFESVEPFPHLCFGQTVQSKHTVESSPNLDGGVSCLLEHLDGSALFNSACKRSESHPQNKNEKQTQHLAEICCRQYAVPVTVGSARDLIKGLRRSRSTHLADLKPSQSQRACCQAQPKQIPEKSDHQNWVKMGKNRSIVGTPSYAAFKSEQYLVESVC